MADVRLELDPEAFERWKQDAEPVERFTRDEAQAVADRARQLAPRDSGRLAQAIDVERARDTAGRFAPGWRVTCDVPYAIYVHEGTRPHPIVGRPLLAFFWDRIGAFVVLPRVNHPGTSAQPFLRDALDVLRR